MSRDAWDEFSKTILVSYIVSYLCGSFYLDRSASLKKIVAFSDRCLSTHALTCLSCALSISIFLRLQRGLGGGAKGSSK